MDRVGQVRQDTGVRWGENPNRRVLWRTDEWMPGKKEPVGQTGGRRITPLELNVLNVSILTRAVWRG